MGGSKRGAGRPELARARRRMGMSQEEIAEALWVSPTTWSRWERGRQAIRPVYRARMAEVFGVDPAEVERWIEGGAPVDTEAWLRPDFSDLSLAATVEAAGRLWRCDMDPDRRHVLAALPFVPAALGSWLSAWSYGAPVASAAHDGSGLSVGLSDVQRIEEARQAFGEMDHRFGAGLVRPAVVDYLNTVVAPLLKGRYTDKVGSALMSVAAGMTQMAGWTAFDLGRHGLAQHYFGQALKLASAGGDALTGVWVLTSMTHQATWLKHSSHAMWLARAAVETARRGQAPPRVLAPMLVREAWATALQARPTDGGDTHAARRAERLLAEAEQVHAEGRTDRDPAWTMWADEPEVGSEIGLCWELLGRYDRAVDRAHFAVREFSDRRPRSAQINLMNMADAYLGMHEVGQAVTSARTAIGMARSLTSVRAVERVRQFSDRLDPYADTVHVKEFRAHLAAELTA
ncbi:helix-turn-helix transcriptional regulator [Sphaerisporangium sp. NPDC005289]|uniref:helix-turn-helix domain-containing protein n=1 Tax=Sphaerisporangium sp. NPDC005289 TaxID=3155247 RepID=UPI0033BBD6CF